VLWHVGVLQSDTLLTRSLLTGPYKHQALIPTTSWLTDQIPETPKVKCTTMDDTLSVSWQSEQSGLIANWVVYARYAQRWKYNILNRDAENVEWPFYEEHPIISPDSVQTAATTPSLQEIIVTAISRTGLESNKQTVWKKED